MIEATKELKFELLKDPQEKTNRDQEVFGVGMFAVHKDNGDRFPIEIEVLNDDGELFEKVLKKDAVENQRQAADQGLDRQGQGVDKALLLAQERRQLGREVLLPAHRDQPRLSRRPQAQGPVPRGVGPFALPAPARRPLSRCQLRSHHQGQAGAKRVRGWFGGCGCSRSSGA